MNTCENCTHRYIDVLGDGRTVCRRYPPQFFIAPNGQGLTMFPPVQATWSCGEHQAEKLEIAQ